MDDVDDFLDDIWENDGNHNVALGRRRSRSVSDGSGVWSRYTSRYNSRAPMPNGLRKRTTRDDDPPAEAETEDV